MGWQLFRDREPGRVHRADEPAQTQPDSDEVFWASPVGRAARAQLRGDRFFQIELDDATIAAYAEESAHAESGRRARRTCDLLGQIEELGWRLEHVSWWRIDGDEPSAHAATSNGEPDHDHVKGVYLFHSVPGADEEASPPPATPDGAHHPKSPR